MANKLLIKRSAVADKVPTTTDLALGELGVNTNDGKLYLKKDNGTAAIVEVAVKDSSGNLGIGTAPSARLHLLSTTEQLRAAYDASNYVKLTVGSTGSVTLDAVGTGAAFTLSDTLSVVGIVRSKGTDSGFVTHRRDTDAAAWTIYSPDATLAFYDNTFGTRAVFDASGNLAIGTTSASARLHLVSTTEQLRVGYDASNYFKATVNGSGSVTLDAVGSGAGFIFSDYVGIGASPSVPLHVTATSEQIRATYTGTTNTASLQADANGGFLYLVYDNAYVGVLRAENGGAQINGYGGTGAYLRFTTANSSGTNVERLRIDSSGNVAVGTTSASARLHLVSTTEQLRVGYDASNYFKATVGSTGTVTLDAVGSGAGFTFNDAITVNQSSAAQSTYGGGYIELGGTSTTPLIDWHSSAVAQDYDVRMIVFGDNTTSARGQLRTYCENSWWTTLANADGYMMLSRNAGYEHGVALATFELSWRWFLAVNSTAESGSNAGSNFAIRRFSDAGASLGDAFFIRRSDGQIGIGTSSPTVPLDVNGVIRATQLRGGYNDTTGSANTAAQALGTNTVSRVLISASTTLTTTVPPAGSHASVIIQTSGTVSRTVTFGTGFKSQGTLATGAVADRYWVVNFVSDGTSLYETSRTTTAYA